MTVVMVPTVVMPAVVSAVVVPAVVPAVMPAVMPAWVRFRVGYRTTLHPQHLDISSHQGQDGAHEQCDESKLENRNIHCINFVYGLDKRINITHIGIRACDNHFADMQEFYVSHCKTMNGMMMCLRHSSLT